MWLLESLVVGMLMLFHLWSSDMHISMLDGFGFGSCITSCRERERERGPFSHCKEPKLFLKEYF
jgi:hypothetical protein